MTMRSKPRAVAAPVPDPRPEPLAGHAPPPAEDPLIAGYVERALAPDVDLFPPEALAAAREYLTDYAASHPAMRRLFDRLRPPKQVASSDVHSKEG